MSRLRHAGVECVPIVHGRLAFALEVRRRLLGTPPRAVAVELPPSLTAAVDQALDALPRASVVLYREQPRFLAPEASVGYVPIQPADGVVEALRLARGERLPVAFIDADVEAFAGRGVIVPDPHALHTLGLERYYEQCLPVLERQPRTALDDLREAHMAARLAALVAAHGAPVLFVGGMAHWEGIRRRLGGRARDADEAGDAGAGRAPPASGAALYRTDWQPVEVQVHHPDGASLSHLMGELPYLVARYEEHRAGFELDDFDPTAALRRLLLEARDRLHRPDAPASFERTDSATLRLLLNYLRKLSVPHGLLLPDAYRLVVAAHGVVGNDYALAVLRLASAYPWNPRAPEANAEDVVGEHGQGRGARAGDGAGERDAPDSQPPMGDAAYEAPDGASLPWLRMTSTHAELDGADTPVRSRTPGTPFRIGRLRLEERPDPRTRQTYRRRWDPRQQCSWPPEDLVIENFRDYVGKRALSLARVATTRSEPFTTSYLDGIDFAASVRDVVDRRIFVREEPRRPGAVGALVVIFEEDDCGERYPWRSTWMAEHHNESTLCFYASDYLQDLIGPGVARAHYGGCLLIYPPRPIPDIWEDLRFERARTPSERLLLAALYWSPDRYIAHVGGRPPRPAVQAEAAHRKKHILHLPLSTFSPRTLERLRRFHVLNGMAVRTWARKFIR